LTLISLLSPRELLSHSSEAEYTIAKLVIINIDVAALEEWLFSNVENLETYLQKKKQKKKQKVFFMAASSSSSKTIKKSAEEQLEDDRNLLSFGGKWTPSVLVPLARLDEFFDHESRLGKLHEFGAPLDADVLEGHWLLANRKKSSKFVGAVVSPFRALQGMHRGRDAVAKALIFASNYARETIRAERKTNIKRACAEFGGDAAALTTQLVDLVGAAERSIGESIQVLLGILKFQNERRDALVKGTEFEEQKEQEEQEKDDDFLKHDAPPPPATKEIKLLSNLQIKLVMLEQHAAEYVVLAVNTLIGLPLDDRSEFLAAGSKEAADAARTQRASLFQGAHVHFDLRLANTEQRKALLDQAKKALHESIDVHSAEMRSSVNNFWRRTMCSGSSLALYYLHRCVAEPTPLQETIVAQLANALTIMGDFYSVVEQVAWMRYLQKDLSKSARGRLDLSRRTEARWHAENIVAKRHGPHNFLFAVHAAANREAMAADRRHRMCLDALVANTLSYIKVIHGRVMAAVGKHNDERSNINPAMVSLIFTYLQLGVVLLALHEVIQPNALRHSRYPTISNRMRAQLIKKNPIHWLE
jgi:hypothetical protein